MTTVRRLNDDLYEFIQEDKCLAGAKAITRVKGGLAQEKLQRLNNIPPLEERQKKVAEECFKEVKDWLTYGPDALLNKPEFNKYIKSLKTNKELQIGTGCKVFNEDLYKKAIDEQRASFAQLRTEGDRIFNDTRLSSDERLEKSKAIMLEIQKLKSIIINKSESRFYTDEILTIKMTPQEAYKITVDFINKRVASIEEAKKKALDAVIEKDRNLFKDYTEEDFKLAKRMAKVGSSGLFFTDSKSWHYRFGGGIGEEYVRPLEAKECLKYDSLEDYIMRPRPEPEYETPELVIDSKERGVFAYMKQIIRDYWELQRLEEIKRLNEAMHEE